VPQPHDIFLRFTPFAGPVPPGYRVDFLGNTIRFEFFAGMEQSPLPVRSVYPGFNDPGFNNEIFEWIDVLESVAAARKSYTMIELGAGYGR